MSDFGSKHLDSGDVDFVFVIVIKFKLKCGILNNMISCIKIFPSFSYLDDFFVSVPNVEFAMNPVFVVEK